MLLRLEMTDLFKIVYFWDNKARNKTRFQRFNRCREKKDKKAFSVANIENLMSLSQV